jgi:O-antigen/teichoic acid export membrane protein
MDNLRKKTINGLIWSFTDQFGVYFIRFGFSIWITRLLSPKDFGLIGLIAIFISVGQMFSESGLQMALIQKKETDSKDYSTVFWFSISISFFVYILIFLFAGNISDFFNEPQLKAIGRVLSLSIIIDSFRVIQFSKLSKSINFKIQAKINFVASIFSGIVGVVLALKGFAVWALVFQTLSGSIIITCLLWIKNSWKPIFIFDVDRFKQLYHYSWKIFLQGLSNAIFTNLYYPLIGKYYSTADLGFYTHGKRFYDIFIHQATISYGRVTFPAFSSIQDQKERLLKNYIKAERLLIFFTIPFVTLLVSITEPFVRFFLTEKWMPSVPYIKMFFLMGLYFPVYILNQNMFNAVGRSDLSLKIDIIQKILLFLVLIFSYKLGILAIIGGQLIVGVFVYLATSYFIQKIICYSILNQLIDYFSVAVVSITVFLVLNLVKNYFGNDLFMMFGILILGSIGFIVFFKITNLRCYQIFKDLFFEYIPKKLKFLF